MSSQSTKQLNQQHERTQGDMEAVETRQNKERRSVDSASKSQPEILISVNILSYLQHQKY